MGKNRSNQILIKIGGAIIHLYVMKKLFEICEKTLL